MIVRDGVGELYNVEEDISESYNLAKKKPEVVESFKTQMLEFDKRLEKEKREVGIIQ